jgi:hypothetical protein
LVYSTIFPYHLLNYQYLLGHCKIPANKYIIFRDSEFIFAGNMKIISRLFVIIFILAFSCSNSAIGQEKEKKKRKPSRVIEDSSEDYYNQYYLRYDNFIYNPKIKSVQLYQQHDELSAPAIRLGSENVLKLSFDLFDLDLKRYQYTVIHCDPDWNPTLINEAEYLDGFFEDYINDYRYSMNTIQRYVHYNLFFPNENIKITRSGNYLLLVFEEGNRDKPIITRRFMVFEDRLLINPTVRRPAIPDLRNNSQKIDFAIKHKNLRILNHFDEIRVAVLQNYRWDNAKLHLKPLFLKENELIYEHDVDNLFLGGNEFRNFDIKTLRFYTEFVRKIAFENNEYHIYLQPQKPRTRENYSTFQDINGNFVIRTQEGWNPDTEADYGWVHFRLDYPSPILDGNLYIYGALSDWAFKEEFKLKYDYETKTYYTKVFLKQGYYNYQYMFLRDGSNKGNPSVAEGSHFETENDYAIFVYHKEPGTNYFRIVGYRHFNSRGSF